VEQATLRPVPLRPVGPVDPAEAVAHAIGALPDLPEDAARALSLIEIAGRTRDKAVEEMAVSADALAELLYSARKALRRSMFPLSASGWCERAERLLSDRIDGVLTPPGPARLDVHLRNCERCVDHERRLSQAREKLVREFIDAHPHTAGAGPAERPAATLRVVEPVVAEPVYDGPTQTVAGFAGLLVQRGDAEVPVLSFAGPGGQVQIRVEAPRVPDPDELPEDPPLDDDVETAEPADTTPSEHDAEDADPPVEESSAASLVWGTLSVLSVGLAVFALVITVLALSIGLDRVF
jgi:putative zinc finger protein